jgi:hypothetical protein
MVEEAGFVIERCTASSIPLPLVFPRAPRWLLDAAGAVLWRLTRLLPRLLGYQIVMRARRSKEP